MKKYCIILFVLSIIFLSVGINSEKSHTAQEFLRIHVRANSNSMLDQSVKIEIKDEIVKFLTPLVSIAESKRQVVEVLENNLKTLEKLSESVLRNKKFNYGATVKLKSEKFPTRVYNEELTLESGVYDALIVELGAAQGDNWWCVIYPPLCFTGKENGGSIVYRSKIVEIIKEFLG